VRHELKTDPAAFLAVLRRIKMFEIRKNDRGFKEGDTLILKETLHTGADMAEHPETFPLVYTGDTIEADVDYVLYGPIYGLMPGWCIMSINVVTRGHGG
jgi:hypothetical protein